MANLRIAWWSATAATAAAILTAGCSRPPADDAAPQIPDAPTSASVPATPSVQAAEIGATLEVAGPGGTAAYTVGNWRAVPADAQIIPAKGAMYSVDVTVEGRSGTTAVNGFYFVARLADGTTVAPAVGAVRPGITYSELGQGQSVSGHVAFDLAPGAAVTGVGLRDPQGKPAAFWSISG